MSEKPIIPSIETFISIFPGNIYWKDRNGVYLGCNDEHARLAGLSSRFENIGKTDFDLCWKADAAKLRENDLKVIESGEAFVGEESSLSPNGKKIIYLSKKIPLRNAEGEVIGLIGTSVDITELKDKEIEVERARQKAEAANISKTNFLAVISHELRTPLNGIFGMAQILHEKLQDETQINHVKDIEQSALHLLALVNDILDFSSVETGKINIRKMPFNLFEIAKSSLSEVKFKLQEKPIRLFYQCDPGVPQWIVGDGVRIKQLILNLIGNAIKFTEQGVIKILISCLEKNEESVLLKIGVKDTGIGISRVMQQKIFERFVQVESEYSRPYEGVGLGLAICKQIVESMGGCIQVESDEGMGSFFWMEIPFKLPNPEQMKQIFLDTAENNSIRDQFDAHILLVEDNVLNQKVAKNMLEGMGCTVDIVDTGIEAIRLVEKSKYDVVFMDVGLPGVDGLTTTETIRKNFQNDELPIIGLTAHALEADIQRCYQATMNDVITKPIAIKNLKMILSKWVRTQ